MCDLCENIQIDIHNPLHASNKKYDVALDVLEKAFGYSTTSGASEIMPYRSVRDLVFKSKTEVEKKLLQLHNEIMVRWLGIAKAKNDPFKLSGRVVLNPNNGQPLTEGEWKIIKEDIMRAFGYIYGSNDEDIARTAMALGHLLADLPVDTAIRATLGGIKPGKGLRIFDTDPQYRAAMQFAQDQAGVDIVDLSNRQYKMLHDTISIAQQNRMTTRKLESDLFNKFGDMNRDWRRIAETEIANNVNTGKLITELARDRVEGDYIYMKGLSSPMACKWWASEVNEKIFVLLEAPPPGGGDSIEIDGNEYTAIWPGKTNVGRPRRDWWVASGTQHPHCMCTWVKYMPGYEKYYKKLDTAMQEASQAAKNQIVPYVMD